MMNRKLCGFVAFAFLAVIALVGFASAASLTISNVDFPSSVNHDGSSFQISFDVTNNGAADPAIGFTLQMSSGTATLTMPTTPIADGTTTPVTIPVSGTVNFPAFQNGNLAGSIIVDDQGGGAPKTVPFIVTINDEPSLQLTRITELTQSQNGTIEIENDGNVDWGNIQLTSSGDFGVEFFDSNDNSISSLSLAAGDSEVITVSGVNLGDIGFGGESVEIVATADDGVTEDTVNMTIQGSFCEEGSVGGDLEITTFDVEVVEGEGDDDAWKLLDIVEIEVEVENIGDDEVEEVFVEIGLFDSNGRNEISDLEFESDDEEEIEIGDLDDGDEETVTFRFQVPADFEDGDYRLTVKAYSDDVGEDEQCVDTSDDLDENERYTIIDVEREDDEGKFIAFDDIVFTPTEATCGDRVSMTLDVFNIGDEDQDQVRVNLRNTELGINEFVEIRTDLDQGDRETVSFEFVIPDDAEDKFYTLNLFAEYDYNRGTYREESDEDTGVPLRIIGCGTTPGDGGDTDRIAIISADLESEEVVPGEEVVIRATITNLKSQRTAFAIDALGYQSWATLDEISPRIIDVPAGESGEVLFTFIVDEGVEGEQSFDIELRDGLGGTEMREIALNVEGTGDGGGFNFGDNAFLWVIGAVNVILVILIIVVAVRVARR